MKIGLIIVTVVGLLTACGQLKNDLKHTQSDYFGLKRSITLYDANGRVIRNWHTRSKVEDRGGSCYFIDNNDKAIIISGSFVIEEE
ncbi:MAG: hypothetical protein EBU90_26245 [Proteobacteria bacterium]|nr:hypothetical protein [Pseudomonadota bacterium]